jgi:hypothetical protein
VVIIQGVKMVDQIKTGRGFEKLENGEKLNYGERVVETEEGLYRTSDNTVTEERAQRTIQEDVKEVYTIRDSRGSASGNAVTFRELQSELETSDHGYGINPEGEYFEEGWSEEYDLNTDEKNGNRELVDRALDEFEPVNS